MSDPSEPRAFGPAMRHGLVAMVLASLGAALGLPLAPGGPTLAFVVATVAALGTRAGVAFAALALCAGLATAPAAEPTLALPALGVALAGLGLGLLGRELDRLHRFITSPALLAALVAVVALATLALPDGHARLADASGAPMHVPAALVDGATFMRRAVELPLVLPLRPPTHALTHVAAAFMLIALVALLVMHLRGAETAASVRRGTWELTALAAALGLVVGLLGLLQILGFFGDVALEPGALRRGLDLAVARDGAIADVAPRAFTAEWRWWSRPWVDGLRFTAFATLLAVALRRFRHAELAPVAASPGLSALTPLGLALTALGAALFAATNGIQGAPLALVAGVVLGVGALASGRLLAPPADVVGAPAVPRLAPLIALAGSALLCVYAWLVTPLFGV